ncbi:hypothetical protein TcCL_ESM04415 [Trypanosoma cruzi]|nr:hypothetical protein TcCL_ESM04415 [Trypanosoma cruzi]
MMSHASLCTFFFVPTARAIVSGVHWPPQASKHAVWRLKDMQRKRQRNWLLIWQTDTCELPFSNSEATYMGLLLKVCDTDGNGKNVRGRCLCNSEVTSTGDVFMMDKTLASPQGFMSAYLP